MRPTDLLYKLGIHVPPIDAIWVASTLGITVMQQENVSDTFVVNEKDEPIITASSQSRDSKKRFECAMALGKMVSTSSQSLSYVYWAIELIMPQYWVRAYRTVANESILHDVFGVTPETMKARLELLKH